MVSKKLNLESDNPFYLKGMNRYAQEHEMAEKIYHAEWYGSPAKQPPSRLYRERYGQIDWSAK
jgi:hypothetical protein